MLWKRDTVQVYDIQLKDWFISGLWMIIFQYWV